MVGVEKTLHPLRLTRGVGRPRGREKGHPRFAAGNTEEQVLARERWSWE